ncbi:putative fungal-specific transcription factor [Triangularia verruculosa]|uniref:Fungal-specific transcription factor n=1 Tax=Triangularia verruculosa TaxID=2587418 RepID=A0AAN7AU70_9PEZI|nr:putative fungal-specific transcription factor [Triangularia verruculosa]
MEHLETQVSDLRSFLAPQPAAAPAMSLSTPAATAAYSPSGPPSSASALGDNSAHQPASPGGTASANTTTTTTTTTTTAAKRRAEPDEEGEATAKQQRSKRNRYTSIACNECKRRKIKCNGQTPCHRCGNLNLQCLYAPNCCSNFKESDEFRDMSAQVSRLQEQVDTLFTAINALRQETSSLRLAPIQDRILPPPTTTGSPSPIPTLSPFSRPRHGYRVPSSFHGPTSMAFTVDVAKSTLHRMGYTGGLGDGNDDSGSQPTEPTPHASPILAPLAAPPAPASSSTAIPRDPLLEFNEAEMLRLCQLHEEEVGAMYPVVPIDTVKQHAQTLGPWLATAKQNPVTAQQNIPGLNDQKTLVLKIVLCCALVVEEHGNSARAARLYESIQPIIDRMLMSEPADIVKLPFLALVAGYRYLSNDEVLAWRVVGHVGRLCLELGLHRREGLHNITDPTVRRNALLTFWSVYVLDRRWSFSTGLPFVYHDDKIDPGLPKPDDYPFLIAMVGYSKLAAKIWGLVDCFEPAVIRDLKAHSFEPLEQEIWEWYESVPAEVQTDPSDGARIAMPSGPTDTTQRVRIWTRLRYNQVWIWLYTPVLHSATSITEHMQRAQKAVDIAKQTIRLLAHINQTTSLYRRCQVFYHQFLTSSIAVLFLASTHAPVEFSSHCRVEFYMALDLVRDMSAKSWVSHRLWRTIRSLKAVAPRLGLEENFAPSPSATRPAATASFPPPLHRQSASDHSQSRNHSLSQSSPRIAGVVPSTRGAAQSHHSLSPFSPQIHSREASHHQSPAGSTPHQPQMHIDEQSNGLRLQTEMSRIYEGYAGLCVNGNVPTTTGVRSMSLESGSMSAVDMGYGSDMHMGQGLGLVVQAGVVGLGDESVYQHIKDMF